MSFGVTKDYKLFYKLIKWFIQKKKRKKTKTDVKDLQLKRGSA